MAKAGIARAPAMPKGLRHGFAIAAITIRMHPSTIDHGSPSLTGGWLDAAVVGEVTLQLALNVLDLRNKGASILHTQAVVTSDLPALEPSGPATGASHATGEPRKLTSRWRTLTTNLAQPFPLHSQTNRIDGYMTRKPNPLQRATWASHSTKI